MFDRKKFDRKKFDNFSDQKEKEKRRRPFARMWRKKKEKETYRRRK